MKKVNWLMIILLVFVLTIIGFIVYLVMAFYGNPITKMIATSQIRTYVEENYPDMNLEVAKAVYNFKFGDYLSHVQSKTSEDTAFTVSWHKGVIQDSYESDVVKHYKTYTRIQMELSKLVQDTISREFPYETFILFADLDKSMDDYSMLTLDMPLDSESIPAPTTLTIYFYENKIDYEVFRTHLLELRDIMKNNKIRMDFYSVVMEKTLEEGEKPTVNQESIYLYDYPADRLDSESLIEDIKEHMAEWEKENEK